MWLYSTVGVGVGYVFVVHAHTCHVFVAGVGVYVPGVTVTVHVPAICELSPDSITHGSGFGTNDSEIEIGVVATDGANSIVVLDAIGVTGVGTIPLGPTGTTEAIALPENASSTNRAKTILSLFVIIKTDCFQMLNNFRRDGKGVAPGPFPGLVLTVVFQQTMLCVGITDSGSLRA